MTKFDSQVDSMTSMPDSWQKSRGFPKDNLKASLFDSRETVIDQGTSGNYIELEFETIRFPLADSFKFDLFSASRG